MTQELFFKTLMFRTTTFKKESAIQDKMLPNTHVILYSWYVFDKLMQLAICRIAIKLSSRLHIIHVYRRVASKCKRFLQIKNRKIIETNKKDKNKKPNNVNTTRKKISIIAILLTVSFILTFSWCLSFYI